MQLRTTLALLSLLCCLGLQAQVVYTTPSLPTQDDIVTVYFDASEGNAELAGFSGDIYAHTGVITTTSSSPSDWKNVQGTWGTADPNVEMTSLGGDLYSITYDINTFYGLSSTDTVLQLAFVFRNADGTLVGRATDGSDIYADVFPPGLGIAFVSPNPSYPVVEVSDMLTIEVSANDSDSLFLYLDDVLVQSTDATTISVMLSAGATGDHVLRAEARAGSEVVEVLNGWFTRPPVNVAALPAGVDDGINIINDSTVTLVLYAPDKSYVFAVGDFNSWQTGLSGYMNQTPDGLRYWITLNGLTPGQVYSYQYYVDGLLRIADFYSELILDENNDQFISSSVYPDMPAFPEGFASGRVSTFQTAQTPYNWVVDAFTKPDPTRLYVYELLIRDFVAAHSYEVLTDTLDYLERMGVTAIELMPVMEFENNISWGYNTSFHHALDKYYGSKDAFKAFVDECHQRGIAVIMDMVFNHAFGQSPQVQLYWDGSRPSPNSPWFNQEPTHDFNVGFDYNHESDATKKYVKDVLEYWITEYKIDGFRMDLSKGFTQNNTLGDIGAFGAYDASRVSILKEYADHVWSVDPTNIFCLEHFADNSEEKELAEYGMFIWGNMNHNYREAAMGWVSGFNSDLTWGSYNKRGWSVPHLITYMESHDEERMAYSNQTWGNNSEAPDYDVRDFATGMFRCEAAVTTFLPLPGPKMIWQFGELGYDINIDFNGRTGPKPIKWEYQNENPRKRLYEIYSALGQLRLNHEVFHTSTSFLNVTGATKKIRLDNDDMNVMIIANMDVVPQSLNPSWRNAGTWYDYFTGESIEVTDISESRTLQPGEYHLYTDVQLSTPDITSGVDDVPGPLGFYEVWPNPSKSVFGIRYELGSPSEVQFYAYDMQGQLINQRSLGQLNAGTHSSSWEAPEAGMFILVLEADQERITIPVVATK